MIYIQEQDSEIVSYRPLPLAKFVYIHLYAPCNTNTSLVVEMGIEGPLHGQVPSQPPLPPTNVGALFGKICGAYPQDQNERPNYCVLFSFRK